MKKILKLVLFLFFIFVIITGPSEERKKTFFDGPCSYAEPSPSPSPVPAPVKEPVVYSRIELGMKDRHRFCMYWNWTCPTRI